MNINQWTLHRAGLLSFWYYDEEEFHFSDGKLLFRGSNGSGKSVTMQSFIPLLLDGNRSPERLDPFGSKARKMENYLLGEESEKEENTAYLYLEFKKQESENFLTIGMGFKAVRGKSLQSWGFSITDGRRIGHDFFLYKEMGEKIPLSRKELENRITTGGQVCDGQGEYMAMVNRLLFGFEDLEEYDELVKLLVQLRTPKLSKDFKPTVIYEIMENSLQPLSEDDLRPMSEAIENMDNIKSRLEELKQSKTAADKIKTAYDKYNQYVLLEKAKSLTTCISELEKLERLQKESFQKHETSEKAYREAEENLVQLDIRKKTVEEKKKELDRHDSLRLKEKLVGLEDSLSELKQQKSEKDAQLDKKKSAERQLNDQLKVLKTQQEMTSAQIDQQLQDMDLLAEEFAFDEQTFMKEELKKELPQEYSFLYIKNALHKQSELMDKAYRALEKEKAKNLEYDRVLKQLDEAKESRKAKEKTLEQSQGLLHETKEELIEKVYTWKKENLELSLPEETLVLVSRNIRNFSPDSSLDELLLPVREQYTLAEGLLIKQVSHLQASRETLSGEQKQLQEEINEWKNRKEPEPPREDKTLRNRCRLESLGVPFVPLYRAVDFDAALPEEIRGRIEEALSEMGLLDALVVPAAYRQQLLETDPDMADKYVFSQPNFLTYNLSASLKVEKALPFGISFEDVDNALKSILMDPDRSGTFLNEEGEFGIGILQGKVTHSYQPRYIGASARKRFREEMVQKLETQYGELEGRIKQVDEQIGLLYVRMDKLKIEFQSFPDRTDLITAANQVKEARFKYERSIEEVAARETEERRTFDELKKLQQEAFEYTGKLGLPADIQVYEEAIRSAKDYKDQLYELERQHSRLLQNIQNLNRLEDSLEALLEDMDHLLHDLTVNRRKTGEVQASYQSSLEQLNLSNYEQIRNEIDECVRLMQELPLQIQQETRRSERERSISQQLQAQIAELDEKLELTRQRKEIALEGFAEEYQLGYAAPVEQSISPVEAAYKICKSTVLPEKLQKTDLINALYEKLQENTPYLREYTIRMDSLFEKHSQTENEQLSLLLEQLKRLNITGKVRGKEIDFYSLLMYIREGMEENERLLKESDRQLFEDILVRNISKKIRAKIYHSEQWVRKMNDLMESMNTSSGLSFSLKWSSKKAETEEQLDTSELVQLLMQEGTLMKESDLNKLSEHFRSKIAQARRIQEDTGKNQTFHSIMREILDYRKWFEFKLFYIKTGQNRKELTNNAFFQLSGGEKAMAMYVPLFSAVYARYQGGRKDCPRIISLDEAFAGVDEKNIRDMFRLLQELKLDFMINSQILWGDYDTVPSLSICELIRPDNADFVTVIRYHWNGVVKQLVTEKGA